MASDTDLHAKFLTRFDTIVSPLQMQRASCLSARRFAKIAGAMWEADGWSDMSENMIRVEVPLVNVGLKRLEDDYRANRVTVNYRAVKDTAEGAADLLDGLFRADVYRSKGGQAFDNSYMDGTSGGMGAWLLANELEDEYDPDSDHQRIRFEVISDADQRVFFDDNARLYDKSDAKDCYVLTAMAKDAYEEQYPDAGINSYPEGLLKPYYDWYRPDVVVVARYYRVEEVTESRRTFENIATGEQEAYWDSDLADDAVQDMLITGWRELPAKQRKRRRVAKYVLNGGQILEPKKYIAGSCIPVIPFYGQRSFIDNQERIQGHVQQQMDMSRVLNTTVSKLTETNALAPREIPIVTTEQIVGHEDTWARANIDRLPYVPINALRDESGQVVSTGPVGKIESPQMPPVAAALTQITIELLQQTGGAGQNADEAKSNVSAEAMDIAATRLDERDGSYMDNFRQSMQRCGEVYLEMARDIYFEPGREVETMAEDGSQSTEKLHEQGVTAQGVFVTKNDLSKGKFNVIADVTEATATRRDKTVRALVNIAQLEAEAGDQQGAQAAIITAVENMDGEGMDDYKKWNRKRGLQLGLFTPTDEEQAEMAKAQQEQQQPDPAQLALLAQAQDFQASAQNKGAQARLNLAKIGDIEASMIQRYADAGLKSVQAHTTIADTALKGHQTANDIELSQQQAANDASEAA